jgi:hypothetical protein
MKKLAFALAVALMSGMGTAMAKLPAPSDEAKAKAAETKAKAAWGDQVVAYKLCMTQNKVVANYRKVKAKDSSPGTVIPTCQDPGPYVPPAPAVAAASAAASAAAPSAKK